jgi:N-carbamoylputrescine amidase
MPATHRNSDESVLRVGLAQLACSPEPDDNVQRALAAIDEAADAGARLVVLPELFRSHYPCHGQDDSRFDLAEPIPGPSTEALGKRAAERGVVVVTTLFERRAAGVYHNTAVTLDADGQLVGLYRKMHIPDDPLYNEKFYFTPGDGGFEAPDTACGPIGPLVCWDQWFPEAARLMALAGADLLLYPTAIGWNPDDDRQEQARQRDAWITVQRAHAVANGLPVLACNRVGFEPDPSGQTPGIQFWGASFVAGPQGEIVATADDQAAVLLVDVDMARSESVRRIWPYLRDRRIDAYQALNLRYRDPD